MKIDGHEIKELTEQELLDRIKTDRDNYNTQRAKELRCFWTWPFGHIWDGYRDSGHRACVICGQKSHRGNYDSNWNYDLIGHPTNLDRSKLALLRKQKRMRRNSVRNDK